MIAFGVHVFFYSKLQIPFAILDFLFYFQLVMMADNY